MPGRTIYDYLCSDEVARLARNTQILYSYTLDHMERFMAETQTLTPADMSRLHPPYKLESFDMPGFAAFLEKRKLSGKTVQQYLTCAKVFLNWAGYHVEYTYRVSNKEIQANKRKHLDRWFSEEEIDMCLQYDFPHSHELGLMFKAIIHVLIETGCRVGEVSNLKPDDLDLDEQYIIVHGKTEPRPVIISEETVEMIRNVLSEGRPLFRGGKLFPSTDAIKSAVAGMLKDLGLKSTSDGRGPHTFRHYVATYLYYTGGMDIDSIAFLLGDTVDTIRSKYLHPTPNMIKKRVLMAWGKWEEVRP